MSWTEIAMDMARLIAAQHGCGMDSFSLDAVEVDSGEIRIQASATMSPLADEIPFELPVAETAAQ